MHGTALLRDAAPPRRTSPVAMNEPSPSSNDASVASSGDELLNVAPLFSQDPAKSRGKPTTENEFEDEFNDDTSNKRPRLEGKSNDDDNLSLRHRRATTPTFDGSIVNVNKELAPELTLGEVDKQVGDAEQRKAIALAKGGHSIFLTEKAG